MRKLIYGMNLTLDGYVAAPGDDLGWSGPSDVAQLVQRARVERRRRACEANFFISGLCVLQAR